MDPIAAVQQVFTALAALKAAVDTVVKNREAADALVKQIRRTGNRLQAALALGLHSSHPGLQEDLQVALKDIDDALHSALKAVFSHFLAGRVKRFVQGKRFAARLQQADDALEGSEDELHKTLQLLHMERLLGPEAMAKGRPAEHDVARLLAPNWAQFQLPSLLEPVSAAHREVLVLVARLTLAESSWILLRALIRLRQHAKQADALAAAGALPALLHLVGRSSRPIQDMAVSVLRCMAKSSRGSPEAGAQQHGDASSPDSAGPAADAGSMGGAEAAAVVQVPSKSGSITSSSSSQGAAVDGGSINTLALDALEVAVCEEEALEAEFPQEWRRYQEAQDYPSGLIPAILLLLRRSGSPALQAQAAEALANLALGSAGGQAAIVAAGGVEALTELLPRDWLAHHAAADWSTHLAGLSTPNKQLQEALRSATGQAVVQRAAAAALCNLTASSLPQEQADRAAEGLVGLLGSGDEGATQAAAAALRNLAFFTARRATTAAARGGVDAQQEQAALPAAAGGALQSAAGGALELAAGAAGAMQDGVGAAQEGVVQPAAGAPAAAAAEPAAPPKPAHIQALARVLGGTASAAAQAAAAGALANLASASGDIREAIPQLVALLGHSHPEVQLAAATALHNCAAGSPANQRAIREVGGVAALERLQCASRSPAVQDVAGTLLAIFSAGSSASASAAARASVA